MSDEDHRQLAWVLCNVKAKVLLSGYQCRLYDELYKKWAVASKETTAAGHRGAVPRTEMLWMNF